MDIQAQRRTTLGRGAAVRFKKHDKIGRADAEDDLEFLNECFVDTGDLAILRDCGDTRRIVIGRTGAGKTTLLQKIEADDRTIRIQPEKLAIEYISNSDILRFVATIGVNLDTFFKLLWRHVLAVEIIRKHFAIVDRAAKATLIERIKKFFTGNKDSEALEYLEHWGDSFWQETDSRIKEVTTKLEEDIKASVASSRVPVHFSAEGARKLSAEEKSDVVQRAQQVINNVQLRKLSNVLELIDRVLDDPQQRYYIVIDRLDENWVEDRVRYPLIRALIETARDFRRIRHAKVILALRVDLIDRVFQLTKDAGFQQEKYESLYLPVTWSAEQLTEVLDLRINHLFRARRAGTRVTHEDVLPVKVGKVPVLEYLFGRTLMRPRDVILFFNYCIAEAVDRSQITATMIRQAEGEYSRDRFRSLGDEWRGQYANLCVFASSLLKGRRASFCVGDLSHTDVEEACLGVSSEDNVSEDDLTVASRRVAECELTAGDFVKLLVEVFFKVGILGVKRESYQATMWSCNGARSIVASDVRPDMKVTIHPCFQRALGVSPDEH